MNKDLYCTYDQAVALKELGFDFMCYETWKQGITDDCTCVKVRHHTMKEGLISACNSELARAGTNEITTPSLAMAAKWLREFKNIEVVVESRFSNYKNIGYDWVIFDDFSGDYALRAPLPFSKTYEEALSSCITEAIKLVKENSSIQ